MTTALAGAIIALAVTFAVAPLVLLLLKRGQVLDYPSDRSSHSKPIPRGGGIALGVGSLAGLAMLSSTVSTAKWAIALAACFFGILGLIEDIVGIPALYRLGLQFAVATMTALFFMGNETASTLLQVLLVIGAIFWLVAFVNAFNFMDGIDGISVTQTVVAGFTWFLVGTWSDVPALAGGGIVIAAAALGFAPYNLPHARMFLGDVGSYFIGAWLAAVTVLGLKAGVQPEAVMAPLALYVADTGTTLIRRVLRRERWYLPHRGHAYQQLRDAGRSHIHVSALVAAAIAACGALGAVSLTGSVIARVAADVTICGVVYAYILAPRWLPSTHSSVARA